MNCRYRPKTYEFGQLCVLKKKNCRLGQRELPARSRESATRPCAPSKLAISIESVKKNVCRILPLLAPFNYGLLLDHNVRAYVHPVLRTISATWSRYPTFPDRSQLPCLLTYVYSSHLIYYQVVYRDWNQSYISPIKQYGGMLIIKEKFSSRHVRAENDRIVTLLVPVRFCCCGCVTTATTQIPV
jgi:hypothetical protein